MKNILIILSFFLMIGCCATKKVVEVPVKYIEKIEYRDSLIYLKDTVYIHLPAEEKTNTTKRDSSHLETSVAISDAWIDNGELNHTLKNKDKPVKTIRDTVFVTKNVIEYKEKEVPIEVPIDVPYIPTFAWICIVFTCCSIVFIIMKIIMKFR